MSKTIIEDDEENQRASFDFSILLNKAIHLGMQRLALPPNLEQGQMPDLVLLYYLYVCCVYKQNVGS